MESKIALTTPSTSRWVRSGKSLHNFCTSSERIIGVPETGFLKPGPKLPLGPLRVTLSGKSCTRKKEVKAASPGSLHRETPPFELLLLLGGLLGSLGLFLQRCAEDVAERRAGIRRAILRHGLLLFGELHRLDREVRLLGAVEARHHGVELLADLEAFRTLLVAVAAKVGPLDEADRSIVANLDVETGVLDRADGDGDRLALADSADSRTRCSSSRTGTGANTAAFELLHTEADALLLDVDVEDLRLDRLTLAVELQRLLARHAPGDVGHVDHAVHIAFEADEQAEFGRILDFAFDNRADRMRFGERFPRVRLRLLQAERDATLLLVDL